MVVFATTFVAQSPQQMVVSHCEAWMASLVGQLHSTATKELYALAAALDAQSEGLEAQTAAVLDKYRVLRAQEVRVVVCV